MERKGNGSEGQLIEPLTRREREILALLHEGLTGQEIADRLTLATSTVRWYTQQMYGKLGVNSKRQAVARARQLGLLAPTPAAPLPNAAPEPQPIPPLPTGTVTFLFTDIQGSTSLEESSQPSLPQHCTNHCL